jgi:hypothetical protein
MDGERKFGKFPLQNGFFGVVDTRRQVPVRHLSALRHTPMRCHASNAAKPSGKTFVASRSDAINTDSGGLHRIYTGFAATVKPSLNSLRRR